MKKFNKILAQAILIAFSVIMISSCDSQQNPISGEYGNTLTNGNGNGSGSGTRDNGVCIDSIPMSDLSSEEASSLIIMIEEEKMAEDVYLYLFDKFGLKVFSNIASSEDSHKNAISNLLVRYSLENPTTGKGLGEFVNQEIQSLYTALINGSVSAEEALKIGALIEETDIEDLDNAIAETDNADIQAVYANLRKGSENHLRSFVKNLLNYGITYSPQVLTIEEYNSIVN